MTDTGLTFKYESANAEIIKNKKLSWLGDTVVQVADMYDASILPLGQAGWQDFGVVSTFDDGQHDIEYFEEKSGLPERSYGSIILGESLEIKCEFSHPTILGFKLSSGNTYKQTFNYAADGQTTVASGATKYSAVLTSVDGLAKGDAVEVDLDGFKEFAYLLAVDSTSKTVYFNWLGTIPEVGATVKKIKGWGTANTSAIGVEQYIGAGVEVLEKQVRKITYSYPNNTIIVDHYKGSEIIKPQSIKSNDKKAPLAGGFSLNIMPQTANIVNDDGVTLNDAVYLGKKYILPYASTT